MRLSVQGLIDPVRTGVAWTKLDKNPAAILIDFPSHAWKVNGMRDHACDHLGGTSLAKVDLAVCAGGIETNARHRVAGQIVEIDEGVVLASDCRAVQREVLGRMNTVCFHTAQDTLDGGCIPRNGDIRRIVYVGDEDLRLILESVADLFNWCEDILGPPEVWLLKSQVFGGGLVRP